jgi:tetratricopeptide (TPR) repeat protein
VIEPWLPRGIREQLQKVSNIAFWGLILLLWTSPDANRAFWGIVDNVTRIFHIPSRQAVIGQALFMESRGWLVIGIIALLFVMKRHDDKSKPKDDLTPYLNAAKQRLSENKPVDAVEETNKALAIDPNFADAWHLRGVCFGLINRHDEALQNFSKALEINPEYADCWYNRACCYALQGRYDEALADLSRAIQLSPDTLREHAKQDVGFRPLRSDPRFQQLVSVSGS